MIFQLDSSAEHIPKLVEFWNRCSQAPFLMDSRLMSQHLEFPGTSVWVAAAAAGQPWQGVLWARHGRLAVTLDAVMVLPGCRRQGVGRNLVQAFQQSLEKGTGLRFGGGDHHFVPGLPRCMNEADGFFAALGWEPDWQAHDLLWNTSCLGPSSWDGDVYRLVTPDQVEPLQNLLSLFGQRWQWDTQTRCQQLCQGGLEEIMGAYQQQRLVGFCHIWSCRSQRLGPSTFWLDRSDHQWGGIGPLGVHPDCRGLGFGAGVVEASMAYLRHHGATRIGVDWTGLSEFYMRCGFQPWLTYRGYHRSLTRA